MDTVCRRCLLKDSFPEDYRKYVETLLKKISRDRRAPDRLYEERLSLCRSCARLDRGTCMGCGCLVELKAAYSREKCPFSHW